MSSVSVCSAIMNREEGSYLHGRDIRVLGCLAVIELCFFGLLLCEFLAGNVES